MHTVTVRIDDSIYQKFIAMLGTLPANKLEVMQDLSHKGNDDPLKRTLQNRLDAIDAGNIPMHESSAFWGRMEARLDAFKKGH